MLEPLKSKLREKKGFIFDLDGCIYRGDRPIDGAPEAILALRGGGKRILFLTNNSTKTPSEYVEKLRRMGLCVEEREVLTSSVATAIYMRDLGIGGCFVVGEQGLISALEGGGFRILGADEAKMAKYVVCGLDTRLTYEKLAAACRAIQCGATFIATNLDPNMPVEEGYIPGAGAIVSALVTATRVKPIVIGKPSRIIMKIALEKIGLDKRDVVMVGDTLNIDIAAAKNARITSLLVLSGSTSVKDLAGSRVKPDEVIQSVAELKGLFY
ncbi:MAG: HAD-IIA family hydrolase [Candidatus Verstraetearchaeota archaeon]|nr:HAD-IIA family hydrolase [Candidatus Verstraetearchaeota archaeon]